MRFERLSLTTRNQALEQALEKVVELGALRASLISTVCER
jgi:hypothetical protein